MDCPEAIDIMADALEGQLEPVFRAGFEEHMGECASCATYFEQLRLTRQALQILPHDGTTSPRRTELIEKFKKEFDRENG